MKEAANRGGPFQLWDFCHCRLNVIAHGARERVQFVAGLFRLDAKEPRRCPAFGTGGPFNCIGMWRARLVGGHGAPFSTGGSAIGLSATDACANGSRADDNLT
jgi:hypothetical protein